MRSRIASSPRAEASFCVVIGRFGPREIQDRAISPCPRSSRSRTVLSTPRRRGDTRIVHNALNDQAMPDKKNHDGAKGRPDKAGTLIRPVPPDALADPRGHKAPAMPSPPVRRNPFGLLGPGRRNRAITPAKTPMIRIQRKPLTRASTKHVTLQRRKLERGERVPYLELRDRRSVV